MARSRQDRLRALPQVGEMLQHPVLSRAGHAAWAIKDSLREVLDELRTATQADEEVEVDPEAIAEETERRAAARAAFHLRRVINATGVVIHTNLGRAPLAPAALARIDEVAGRYSNVEFDLEQGQRGGRGAGVARLVSKLTGAESALVVNNNASAVYLLLRGLAEGREVIVSRGELVEIGGSFRIPDVMRDSGAVLREVGATNRTHVRDYEGALGEETALLMKVHRSNFRIVGFTSEVERGPLVELGRRHGVPVYEDLGSGQIESARIGDEPLVRDVISAGVDLVSFSGDKLLGGCQAGIIAGRADLVGQLARHPLMRVLRVDKLVYAALEGTLRCYLDGRADEVPAHRAVNQDPGDALARARRLRGLLARRVPDLRDRFEVEVAAHTARAGGGALPMIDLPGHAVTLRPLEGSANRWADELRRSDPPVIVHVQDERLWLDPRTLLPGDDRDLADALARIVR